MGNKRVQEKLTPNSVYQELSKTFPKQNDFGESDYIEELKELLFFGIETKEELEKLLLKHKNNILTIDREPLDEQHVKWYNQDPSIDNLENKVENNYWFALPALLRISLELEFGDEYEKFANERDQID
ncbi:MAG: hypothetical protein ABJO02_05900 [Reichenbachiella sp.]|uniref:hypothetical protein n=1 Tax=Reichenbachiella sp. TaxID=2184521 RepID=UPI00329A1A12